MARRITVRTTTEMVVLLDNSEAPWCPVCGGVMATLQQGPMLCGVAIDELNRWLESGAVHHSGPDGPPHMVCVHSLLVRTQNNNPA